MWAAATQSWLGQPGRYRNGQKNNRHKGEYLSLTAAPIQSAFLAHFAQYEWATMHLPVALRVANAQNRVPVRLYVAPCRSTEPNVASSNLAERAEVERKRALKRTQFEPEWQSCRECKMESRLSEVALRLMRLGIWRLVSRRGAGPVTVPGSVSGTGTVSVSETVPGTVTVPESGTELRCDGAACVTSTLAFSSSRFEWFAYLRRTFLLSRKREDEPPPALQSESPCHVQATPADCRVGSAPRRHRGISRPA
jgi:hypothetical protein